MVLDGVSMLMLQMRLLLPFFVLGNAFTTISFMNVPFAFLSATRFDLDKNRMRYKTKLSSCFELILPFYPGMFRVSELQS